MSLTSKSLAAFIARFAALYGVLLLLCWALPVLRYGDRLVAGTTQHLMPLLESSAISRTMVVELNGDIHVYTDTPLIKQSPHIIFGPYYHHSFNLLVFLALVLATPGLEWRQRAAALAIGGAAMLFVDALVLVGDIWALDREYFSKLHPDISTGLLPSIVDLVRALHPTGGIFMLPLFLWAFALVSPVFVQRVRSGHDVGRNDPCPCGSGKKYKACCAT